MQLHLVDATYELFRAHFAPRPPVLGRDGIPLSGVSGLCDQLLYLLREEGATHVGCATDRVIESFRNDLSAGYKSSAGMPPELLAQFPIAEAAVEALGIVLWPMVEFEADDAIAAAAVRFGADPARREDPGLHARQGHGPARRRRADRALGPAPQPRPTTTPACARSGASPRHRSRTGWPSSAIRRTATRASPAGARSPPRRCWRATAISMTIPPKASAWEVPGVGGTRAASLAASLRDHWDEAMLYRDLARLRTVDDGVPLRQTRARRAPLGRHAPRRVGGVLRGMGPAAAGGEAPSLARGLSHRSVTAWRLHGGAGRVHLRWRRSVAGSRARGRGRAARRGGPAAPPRSRSTSGSGRGRTTGRRSWR